MELFEFPKNKTLMWVGIVFLVLLFCCCCLVVTLATVLPVIDSGKLF